MKDARRAAYRIVLLVGVIALIVTASGALSNRQQFFVSYLYAYLFWLGLSFGSMAILMVHHLTGGGWGYVIRRPLLAAIRLLAVMALLFIPIVFGLHDLYPWTRPELVAHDPILERKQWYLNESFFLARATLYFLLTISLALLLLKWTTRASEPGRRLQYLSAGGLVVYALVETFAAFDWIMSLIPHWHSTTFGLLVGIGQMLGALAFVIAIAAWLTARGHYLEAASPLHFHDLGNLLLMFIMIWAYLAFTQYLVIWIEDLPAEIQWFLPRSETSWRWLALILYGLQVVVPFLLLLLRRLKRDRAVLGGIAAIVLFAHWGDLFWLVAPSFRTNGVEAYWTDLVAFIGIGGIWLGFFIKGLAAVRAEPITGSELVQHG